MAAGYVSAELSLDDIDSFFDINPTRHNPAVEVKGIPRSSKQCAKAGAKLVHADALLNRPEHLAPKFVPPYKRKIVQEMSNDYASYYQQEEEALSLRSRKPTSILPDDDTESALAGAYSTCGMEDLECSTMGDASQSHNDIVDNASVYYNYDMNHKYNPNLPITKYREEIVNLIEANQVTVIEGPTGSGKTTQVPQYILDHYASNGKYCNIVVTQPRRIAAISIARRVCAERTWGLKGLCGYQIGMDRQASEDTRLLFLTTQVLLRKLISAKSMQAYTHVILDEVHERDQYSDFCLLVVRKLLRTNSRDVKVILMSATIETTLFANYLKVPVRNEMQPAPVISVEGGTYRVSEFFVEDLQELGQIPELAFDEPGISPASYELAKKLILQFDNLETKQQGRNESTGFAPKRGSVLVFLPGLAEIAAMDDELHRYKTEHRLNVLPLHSTITGEEQARVFEPPIHPQRKVILSTNIAESSITVTDVKYVIDFCLTKNLTCDNDTYTSLQVEWASKSNCIQRKGRAGRVSNGRVYRMITRDFWHDLPEHGTPEMQRCPLENLVLQTKLLGLGEPKAILGLALSPPNLNDIEKTILVLKETGALKTAPGAEYNPHDGDLTFMGRVLGELPVDIHIGKLIMLGYTFGFLEDCIIIGAMLSLKSVFATPFKAKLEAYKARLAWADGSKSDCIAMLNAYKLWDKKSKRGDFPGGRAEIKWTKSYMLQLRRLYDVRELVKELTNRLRDFNILAPYGPPIQTNPDEDLLILKVIVAGAFYPNYAIGSPGDEEMSNKTLCGHNPFTTVMVKGLPNHQGGLYREAIQKLFEPCLEKCHVHFEDTRAYIEFPKNPGSRANEYSLAVYLALKMKQLDIPLFVYLLDEEEAYHRLKALNRNQNLPFSRFNRVSQMGGMPDPRNINQVELPNHSTSVIQLNITEIVECGLFWAHYGDDKTWCAIDDLQTSINANNGQHLKPLADVPTVGMFCLAFFPSDHNFYRARVESLEKQMNSVMVRVFFVDYGNITTVSISELRELELRHKQIRFQAFQCQVAHIKPSPIQCAGGRWTKAAMSEMYEMVTRSTSAFGKVYSVVHGILRLELQLDFGGRMMDMRKHLVEKGFADHAEESFLSKQDHADREDEQVAARLSQSASPPSQSSLVKPFVNMSTSEKEPVGAKPARKYGALANRICLTGPTTPYEVKFSAITAVGCFKDFKIDRDGVNSIMLDEDPADPHTQLLVAANVTVNPSRHKILARDTTLMPRIPGLPGLMALLFTPKAEVRVDPSGRRYTGALCGLGWDPFTDGPAFPDHDMELTFDTYIDNSDLDLINKVRLAINIAIGNGEDIAEWGPDGILKVQRKARQRVLNLLHKRRETVTPEYFRFTHHWNQIDPKNYLLDEPIDEENFLLNLHPVVALHVTEDNIDTNITNHLTDEQKEKLLMREHINWLRQQASSDSLGEPVKCLVCNYKMVTLMELKLHLAGRMHKEQETKYLI